MLPDIYKKWFNDLYFGTTSKGKQELIDSNKTYSLIRIRHNGAWSGMAGKCYGGYTEWMVAINGGLANTSYGYPKTVWIKQGRLLNEDKKMILEKFNLNYKNNKYKNK